jgi:hypothetical protein
VHSLLVHVETCDKNELQLARNERMFPIKLSEEGTPFFAQRKRESIFAPVTLCNAGPASCFTAANTHVQLPHRIDNKPLAQGGSRPETRRDAKLVCSRKCREKMRLRLHLFRNMSESFNDDKEGADLPMDRR